ncbi:MAG TPA: hypothetical protein VNA69_02540 [Thermoanaerobaculia bacterium]|nr:hypothetical protein [Thermoanaerobaculia bacterium]
MTVRWPKEAIPDDDILYMRVHLNNLRDGELQPGVFQDREGSMSTNWQKYCPTPEEARAKARNPARNGVIQAVVRDVRAARQVVEHSPDEARGDRSHTSVIGAKTAEVRLRLYDAFTWSLRVAQ